jgi:hypothetical protein
MSFSSKKAAFDYRFHFLIEEINKILDDLYFMSQELKADEFRVPVFPPFDPMKTFGKYE